jgi:hypothetical protein
LAWKSAEVITSGYLFAAFAGVVKKIVLLIINVANSALTNVFVRINFSFRLYLSKREFHESAETHLVRILAPQSSTGGYINVLGNPT